MKNLATCKPTEFLSQTIKIRKYVAKWIKDTNIFDLKEKLEKFSDGISEDEKKEIVSDKIMKSLGRIFDEVFEKHGEETLGLLALLCFVEPENVDDYTMDEYLGAIADMVGNDNVFRFFTSSARWGKLNI